MAFVNASLIFGGLFVAVPIVLHLVMRRQPKHLVFPALQFIKPRRDANRRKLQLRHWLLLFFRCAAIALLALALARPSVDRLQAGNWLVVGLLVLAFIPVALLAISAWIGRRERAVTIGTTAIAGLLGAAAIGMAAMTLARGEHAAFGNSDAPVGAVLVFDTSPRMQYVWQNKSRLEQAREIGLWLTRQLPPQSEVAVIQSLPQPGVFAVDLAAAQTSIEKLEVTGVPVPLPDAVINAIELAEKSAKPRREVYVMTDRTRAAWSADAGQALAKRLAQSEDVLLYIVDVGADDPQNKALGQVRLSAEMLANNEPLYVETDVETIGTGGTATVELYMEQPTLDRPIIENGETLLPPLILRNQEVVELPAGESATIGFHLNNLPRGVHQGQIKLVGQDGLMIDNQRFFTVEVQDALPLLVVAPAGVTTKYFVEAVAPYEQRKLDTAKFSCTVRPQTEIAGLNFDEYAAVVLLDPLPMTPPDWERLSRYVADGGGLAVFLGHNADTTSFNADAATTLLGGKLVRQWRSAGDLFLSPRDYQHPITIFFRDHSSTTPWDQSPVFRHWLMDEFMENVRLVMPYNNNKPAIIETTLGSGRVVTMTTPISDPLRPAGRSAWNEIPTSEAAWPYVVIVNETMNYLVDVAKTKLNYVAGETAVLPNSRDRYPQRYQLFSPIEQPQEVSAGEGRVIVGFTEFAGAYRLKGNRGGPVIRGFSVNLPPEASDLERLPREALDELLGENRFYFARSQEEIVMGVGQARMGREFFPLLLVLAAATLALESLLGNRFYRERSGAN